MRHISCDLCGKDLTGEAEAQFVLRMEAFPAAAPAGLTGADLDQDHIDAMAEMLEEMEEAEDAPPAPKAPAGRTMEYDLCPVCYRRFLADPLGLESTRRLSFSKN